MTRLVGLARAAGFLGVLGIIVLSLVPGAVRPHTGLPGAVEHFLAYALTASALSFGFRPLAYRIVFAAGLALLAGLMEILQHFVPGRHPAAADAFVSSLGGLFGLALGSLLRELAVQAYRKYHNFGEAPGPLQ
ncbi:MAG TPA: VanZ family protein [Methylocella sp.]|nr:VanZ family protein [Methylocella sp.]